MIKRITEKGIENATAEDLELLKKEFANTTRLMQNAFFISDRVARRLEGGLLKDALELIGKIEEKLNKAIEIVEHKDEIIDKAQDKIVEKVEEKLEEVDKKVDELTDKAVEKVDEKTEEIAEKVKEKTTRKKKTTKKKDK
jgi:Ran GTPase-activating protein (RanGAP) involved in mRNA processing and transport